jgi:hypothetical protein
VHATDVNNYKISNSNYNQGFILSEYRTTAPDTKKGIESPLCKHPPVKFSEEKLQPKLRASLEQQWPSITSTMSELTLWSNNYQHYGNCMPNTPPIEYSGELYNQNDYFHNGIKLRENTLNIVLPWLKDKLNSTLNSKPIITIEDNNVIVQPKEIHFSLSNMVNNILRFPVDQSKSEYVQAYAHCWRRKGKPLLQSITICMDNTGHLENCNDDFATSLQIVQDITCGIISQKANISLPLLYE